MEDRNKERSIGYRKLMYCCNNRSGLVESKLRQLIIKLEYVEMLILAHPYTKGVDKVHYCLTEQEQKDVLKGVELPDRSFTLSEGNMDVNYLDQIKEKLELTEEQVKNIKPIYTTWFFIGLYVEPKPGNSFYFNVCVLCYVCICMYV